MIAISILTLGGRFSGREKFRMGMGIKVLLQMLGIERQVQLSPDVVEKI